MQTGNLKEYSRHFSEYTELRMQENHSLTISLVDGDIMGNDQSTNGGVSARVFKNGCWGFASHPDLSSDSAKKVILSATENAVFLDTRLGNEAVELPSAPSDIEKSFGTNKTRKNQKEIIDFMKEIDRYIQETCPKLASRTVAVRCMDMAK